MLFGRSFRLNTPALGLTLENGKRICVTVHPGSILKVISHCQDRPNAMVDVLVDGSLIQMFAVDVRDRSDEVGEVQSST